MHRRCTPLDATAACTPAVGLGQLHKDSKEKSHAEMSFEIASRTSVTAASSPREKKIIMGFKMYR